jgi:hypothetical protein
MVSYYTFLRIFEIFSEYFSTTRRKNFTEIFFADFTDNLKKKEKQFSAKFFHQNCFSSCGKILKKYSKILKKLKFSFEKQV